MTTITIIRPQTNEPDWHAAEARIAKLAYDDLSDPVGDFTLGWSDEFPPCPPDSGRAQMLLEAAKAQLTLDLRFLRHLDANGYLAPAIRRDRLPGVVSASGDLDEAAAAPEVKALLRLGGAGVLAAAGFEPDYE